VAFGRGKGSSSKKTVIVFSIHARGKTGGRRGVRIILGREGTEREA